MAINAIQYSPTSKEFAILFPWKGDQRCGYFELGKLQSL